MTTPTTPTLSPGQTIRLTQCKADGSPYRWHEGRVERVLPDCITVIVRPGLAIEGTIGGGKTRWFARYYLWLDRNYNLWEGYHPDGAPRHLYVNIASPAEILDGEIRYTDYELDLLQPVGGPTRVLDEDEFAEAVLKYGYSPEFQTQCWAALAKARDLIETWRWAGALPPVQPGDEVRLTTYKSDGQVYRWNLATVVETAPGYVVLTAPVGTYCDGPKGGWRFRHDCLFHLWTDRPYNLIELRNPDGSLVELYLNIASPVRFSPGEVAYTDLELDVVKHPGQPAKVEDEDEFQEAAGRYGYTEAFQRACRQAVTEALIQVESWSQD